MEFKELIQKLTKYTLPITEKGTECSISAHDVWNSLIQLASNDEKKFFAAFTFVSEYLKENEGFLTEIPPQISEDISKVSKTEDKEGKDKLFRELFSLMPLFDEKLFMNFVSVCVDFVQNFLNENKSLPYDFLNVMQLADLSIISEDILIIFYETMKTMLSTEKKAAAMIFVTILLQDIVDEEGAEAGDFFTHVLIDGLKSEAPKEEKIAAMYLLSKMNHYYGALVADEGEVPIELFNEFSQYLVAEDKTLFTVSQKTLVQLIKCGVFSEKEHISAVLNQYSSYKEDMIPQFFKLIAKYLDDYESVPTSITQIFYDFLLSINGKGTPYRNAFCLEAFSLLAAVNKDVLDDTTEALLSVSQELVQNEAQNPLIISKVASFILALTKTNPETLPLAIEKFLPVFVACITSETKKEERKAKLDLGQSLSATIEGSKFEQFSKPTIDFAIKMLEDAHGGELVYIGSIIIGLRKEFTKEQANIAFKLLSNIVASAPISQDVNICLHMMKKLMGNQDIEVDAILSIVDKIITGSIESLNGVSPYLSADAKTVIFYFVGAFFKKFPLKCGSFASTIASWVPNTRVELLPAVLEAVEAAIVANILNQEDVKNLYTVIMKLLVKVPIVAEEEYCSVVEILILIINHYPVLCDAAAILNSATRMLALCHGVLCGEEESEDVEPCEDTLVLPTLARLVLSTYASTQLNAEVSKDLLTNVLEDIPASSMPDILPLMLKLIKQTPRFKIMLVPMCRMIVELLMLKKSDIEEIGLDDETIALAKSTLKETFKGNKLVEKQIMRNYSSSRAKLNKFNSLFK